MNAFVTTSEPESQTRLLEQLDFHAPVPKDIHWARPILLAANRMSCEFCFGNVFGWSKRYGVQITQSGGFFLSRSVFENRTAYCFPVHKAIDATALREVIGLLREDAKRNHAPFSLYGLMPEDIPMLEAACPGEFSYTSERGNADYIYRRQDLAELAGKKYHQKRNHIARFMRNNSWSYEEIDEGNMDECLEMARTWKTQHAERDPEGLAQEEKALRLMFAHYSDFGLRGGLLRAGGKVVAFSVGERLNETTFCTHFEKANPEPGAYQMINQCFAEQTLREYEFINREEDMGDEGLRRAKLSYYPALLMEKYVANEQ